MMVSRAVRVFLRWCSWSSQYAKVCLEYSLRLARLAELYVT